MDCNSPWFRANCHCKVLLSCKLRHSAVLAFCISPVISNLQVLERPITPSEREPLQSRASSHHHSRSPHREGEGRGCEGGEGGRSEMDLLNESTLESKKQLMAAEEK